MLFLTSKRDLTTTILDYMNNLTQPSLRCRLTIEFPKDLLWWDKFLDDFYGKCHFFRKSPSDMLKY